LPVAVVGDDARFRVGVAQIVGGDVKGGGEVEMVADEEAAIVFLVSKGLGGIDVWHNVGTKRGGKGCGKKRTLRRN
jgi:hypothetical protein